MALAQETVVATQVEVQRYSYAAISLTNFASDTLEPQIAQGSRVEIGAALFVAAGAESITGWGGIAVSNDVYIKLTVSGASATASFTTTPPTWSESKQGFYSGLERYIGGLYKDAGGNYARKWLYEEKQVASIKRFGNGTVAFFDGTYWTAKKRLPIGDWNMNSGWSKSVAHGLDITKIRRVDVQIRDDADANHYPLDFAQDDSGNFGGVSGRVIIESANISMETAGSGSKFRSTSFDSTSYNRGWIIIEYEP